jgi:hypothetical protein
MSRLDKIKKQHPDLNISLIDIISFLDPTDSYKYLDFLIKNFKNDNDYYSPNKEEFMGYMGVFLFGSGEIETLNEFERHSRSNRIQNKDISSYNNFLELHEVVKKAEEIEKRKQLEKEILKIHEDDTWLILTPLSFESSKAYGSNTKWCVTQEKYWVNYLSTHRLVYVINKTTGLKIAFSRNFRLEHQRNRNNQIQAWNEQDKEIDPMSISEIPDQLFLMIKKELQMYKTTGELAGIENNTLLTTLDSFHGTINIHPGGPYPYSIGTTTTQMVIPDDLVPRPTNPNRRYNVDRISRLRDMISSYPDSSRFTQENDTDWLDDLP